MLQTLHLKAKMEYFFFCPVFISRVSFFFPPPHAIDIDEAQILLSVITSCIMECRCLIVLLLRGPTQCSPFVKTGVGELRLVSHKKKPVSFLIQSAQLEEMIQ